MVDWLRRLGLDIVTVLGLVGAGPLGGDTTRSPISYALAQARASYVAGSPYPSRSPGSG